MTVIHMDCLAGMKILPPNSVDSIVTDPPYELGFMGKSWDASGIAYNVEMWREALRVLKPGGHLLAFSGSRTYHRMTCAIEDAGFEVRDQIMWVYGSGFPKSLDVSKAIDKAAGVTFDAVPASGVGFMNAEGTGGYNTTKNQLIRSGESTDAARQWQGWGTALKPAHEPICVARKPLVGTVAANVLAYGTGAINVDGCRVPTNGEKPKGSGGRESWRAIEGRTDLQPHDDNITPDAGRWPANLIHDGSDEVLASFPQAPGQMANASTSDTPRAGQNVYGAMRRVRGAEPSADSENEGAVGFKMRPGARRLDDGSAARFFYCAKASKADRDEGLESFALATTSDGRAVAADNAYQRGKTERANTHPTVKPTDLMRYLCRLVTPPGGIVLDPFTGSGSTGKAATLEGFTFIGFELQAEYVAIARARIDNCATR